MTTDADKQMITALANVVVNDRLARAVVVGVTSSGRTKVEFTGDPTEAEQAWVKLQQQYDPKRKDQA